MNAIRLSLPTTLLSLALVLTLAACSDNAADGLAGPDLGSADAAVTDAVADVDAAVESDAGSPELAGSSNRLKAELNPVINVDASGHARLENEAGTANDRFDSEVEIAKADFGRLGIDAGDGFNDEVVRLRVLRGGTELFNRRLQFSENRPADITFEFDIRGPAAPELQAGDVARVSVNGRSTLRGTFRVD
jgi:hypothetical protein